jgi:DNA helicase-2/ATP-dependent DNA helicase PcrA
LLRAISDAKGKLVSPENLEEHARDGEQRQIALVYRQYQDLLLTANAADFDDLLVQTVRLLHENPELRADLDDRYRYVMVDEYQDTNTAQYALVRALSIDHRNLSVTGDPDQSIYGWRGANLNNILDFEHDYPDTKVVRLEENFRSTQRIVRVAAHLISFNKHRKDKTLFTHNPEGEAVRQIRYVTQQDEADDIAEQIALAVRNGSCRPSDFAVFYRVNALSRTVEHALRRRGIPYQVVRGLEFYQRREIKDLLAFLQLINNPRDDAALRRIINVPPRSIGRKTVEKLQAFGAEHRVPMLQACSDPRLLDTLGPRPATALYDFARLQSELGALADQRVEEILGQILSKTGYEEYLAEEGESADEDRRANVRELLNEAREFDADLPEGPWLEPFLERAALVADVDQWEAEASKVSLMTLHAAKGLEFPRVFIVGLEERILPHERAGHDELGMEEERRLLFVGITRCKEQLQLSHADMRMRGGGMMRTVASSFLFELPIEDVARIGYAADHPYHHVESYVDMEDVSQAPPERSSETVTRHRISHPLAISTAAQMLKGRSEPATSTPVDEFSQGMLVVHPEYGYGRIVALSGTGAKRTATLRFLKDGGQERKFVLKFSGLTPVKDEGAE